MQSLLRFRFEKIFFKKSSDQFYAQLFEIDKKNGISIKKSSYKSYESTPHTVACGFGYKK